MKELWGCKKRACRMCAAAPSGPGGSQVGSVVDWLVVRILVGRLVAQHCAWLKVRLRRRASTSRSPNLMLMKAMMATPLKRQRSAASSVELGDPFAYPLDTMETQAADPMSLACAAALAAVKLNLDAEGNLPNTLMPPAAVKLNLDKEVHLPNTLMPPTPRPLAPLDLSQATQQFLPHQQYKAPLKAALHIAAEAKKASNAKRKRKVASKKRKALKRHRKTNTLPAPTCEPCSGGKTITTPAPTVAVKQPSYIPGLFNKAFQEFLKVAKVRLAAAGCAKGCIHKEAVQGWMQSRIRQSRPRYLVSLVVASIVH